MAALSMQDPLSIGLISDRVSAMINTKESYINYKLSDKDFDRALKIVVEKNWSCFFEKYMLKMYKLGEGSNGKVYGAKLKIFSGTHTSRHLGFGVPVNKSMPVAIKFAERDQGKCEVFILRILREVTDRRICPFFVHYYGMVECDDVELEDGPFDYKEASVIFMEKLGTTLQSILNMFGGVVLEDDDESDAYAYEEALGFALQEFGTEFWVVILLQVTLACATMEALQITHYDLFPRNIMLTPIRAKERGKMMRTSFMGTSYVYPNIGYIVKLVDFEHGYTDEMGLDSEGSLTPLSSAHMKKLEFLYGIARQHRPGYDMNTFLYDTYRQMRGMVLMPKFPYVTAAKVMDKMKEWSDPGMTDAPGRLPIGKENPKTVPLKILEDSMFTKYVEYGENPLVVKEFETMDV